MDFLMRLFIAPLANSTIGQDYCRITNKKKEINDNRI